MDTLQFVIDNLGHIGYRAWEHACLVGISVALAIVVGVPIGIVITLYKKLSGAVLYLAALIITVPVIALFGMLIPIFSALQLPAFGTLPAIFIALLYSLVPIVLKTCSAIVNLDPVLRETAHALGMTARQRLEKVEAPLAMPVIMAGVRNATVTSVGIIAIAAYIGAGGLGGFIRDGIANADTHRLVVGALTVGLLAVIADYGLLWLQNRLTPAGFKN